MASEKKSVVSEQRIAASERKSVGSEQMNVASAQKCEEFVLRSEDFDPTDKESAQRSEGSVSGSQSKAQRKSDQRIF